MERKHISDTSVRRMPSWLIVVRLPYSLRTQLPWASLINGQMVHFEFAAPFVANGRRNDGSVRFDGKDLGVMCDDFCDRL